MSNRYFLKFGIILSTSVFLLLCLQASQVFAQSPNSQILSVTPPLFQLTTKPGDIWQSSIKVVNGNAYPLTIYAEVVNFKATGEAGQGKFIPVISGDNEKATLAEWITVNAGPHTIPPEQTSEISFFVDVPPDAPPGGHYAAILIGTQPPAESNNLVVQTSQAVTSLFFVRIEGDVHEIGTIREFTVIDSILPAPEAEFSLRFENKGNVHLQPRGDIVITNMWGTERGKIPVNYQTHFGNVLPESIRDFSFSWKSDFSITDVGRYKAVATLAYGDSEMKSVTSTTYFWIIPIKATLITLIIIAIFIGLIVGMIKLYVRRMLLLAGVDPNRSTPPSRYDDSAPIIVPRMSRTYRKVSAPFRSGVLDLRERLSTVEENVGVVKTIWDYIVNYRMFFGSICVLIVIFVTAVLYIGRATDADQEYQVSIDEGDTEKVIESSELDN